MWLPTSLLVVIHYLTSNMHRYQANVFQIDSTEQNLLSTRAFALPPLLTVRERDKHHEGIPYHVHCNFAEQGLLQGPWPIPERYPFIASRCCCKGHLALGSIARATLSALHVCFEINPF